MSPNEQKMHFRGGSDLNRFFNQLQRGDADGASGAVDQRDGRREKFVDPELHDGVRLSSAHLHDCPWFCRDALEAFGKLTGRVRIAVFIDEFHWTLFSSNSANSPICRRYSKTSWASASSMMLIANPTWTRT